MIRLRFSAPSSILSDVLLQYDLLIANIHKNIIMKQAMYDQSGILSITLLGAYICVSLVIPWYRQNNYIIRYHPNSSRNGATKLCSVDTIREFIADHRALPGSIKWTDVGNFTYPKSLFTPFECKYPLRQIRGNYIAECMRKKNVSRIAILGDSTGLLYYKGLLTVVNSNKSVKCKIIRYERRQSKFPEKQYYTDFRTNSTDVIFTRPFDCFGCSSRMDKCTYFDGMHRTDMIFEYLAMEYTLDKEINTHR